MHGLRLGVVIFARYGSSRLPGKMLMQLGEMSLLERVIQRAGCLEKPIVVATSIEKSDDAIERLALSAGARVFRGSLDDVLSRALGAAIFGGFDAFARICGDRPFFSIEEIEDAFEIYEKAHSAGEEFDLITNQLHGSTSKGTTTEILRTGALVQAMDMTFRPDEREHITQVFYRKTSRFRIAALPRGTNLPNSASLAIDTEEDLIRLGEVIKRLPRIDASPEQACRVLSRTV